MDASPIFNGAALSFSVTGEGVAIDPATGTLSIDTAALRAGVAVTVTAANSGGTATSRFRVTVAAEELPVLVAPAPLAPPALAGPGTIGAPVTVDPGAWSGDPAPDLAFAWCRDGAPIADATGTGYYLPVAADDRTDLTCRVIATNAAGSAEAVTAALRITHAAPVATGGLPDLSFGQGSGTQTVAAAPAFAGAGLVFGVTGAGASIDPASGVVSIPTDAALAGELVTVAATNSGGTASASFRVTVVAVVPAFPPAIPTALWSAVEVRDAAPAGRRRIALDAGILVPAGFELRLYSGPVDGGQAALSNRVMIPGETFTTAGSMAVGATCHNLLFWRRIADGSWAPASATVISFPILGLEPVAPLPPVLIAAPLLAGTGLIGSEVTVAPGSWGGDPTPELAFAWCRDGAPIVDATGTGYLPVAADDRTDLTCRVIATNAAGSAEAVTAALRITYAAPVATGGLPDLSFDQGSGTHTVAAVETFAGAGLVFGVTGAGASIDPATGVVSIPTDAALAGELVTVAATNSGGTVSAGFRVTVVAVIPAFPLAIPAALWSAVEIRDVAPAGRRRIALDAGILVPAGFELRLYSGSVDGGQAALSNRIMAPGETFTTSGTMAVGATCHNLLFWRRIADGTWAPASATVITFPILGLEPVAPLPVPPVLVAAPLLAGAGLIGSEVTLNPGSWGGDPTPELAFAWCRNGVAIGGVAGTAYTPGPEDDLAALTCRVTATNAAGSRAAETAALAVAYPAPTAAGGLPDEVFDEDSGPQSVPVALDFTGENLTFGVEGAGATIDPVTGVVSVPTDTPVSGALVTVTAANSGGSASSAFQVTVEAAETAIRSAIYRHAAIPPAGSSFSVSRDVGAHEPGRLVWVMVIANHGAAITIDGQPGRLVDSGSVGDAVGQIYVSETTASEVRVVHSGAHLTVPCVLWFTTVGYAATPAAVARAGDGGSNQSPASVQLAVPEDGAVLAGGRNYNLLTAPGGLQNFGTGGAGAGVTAGALELAEAVAGLTVTAGRDAGNIGGKQLQALVLAPASRSGPGEEEPEEPEEPEVPPGSPTPTSLRSSVSKNGVTFTFAAPRPVGSYVNGDPFVIGPVTITAIAPASTTVSTAGYAAPSGWDGTTSGGTRAINGTEVNPGGGSTQGFDQYIRPLGAGGATYDAAKNVDPARKGALALSQGSVVKCVSVTGDPSVKGPTDISSRASMQRYVVLTVVTAAPPAGSFRPPVSGTDKKSYWTEANINYAKLRNLPEIAGFPTLQTLADRTSAVFMAWNGFHNDKQQALQSRQYPPYGRELSQFFGDCLLRLHMNATNAQKRALAINVCQIGIDICQHLTLGGAYPGEGATMPGRKAPAVFAAVLLDNARYKAGIIPDIVGGVVQGPGSAADDNQILTVQASHVSAVEFADSGTSGRARRVHYKAEDVGFPEWTSPARYLRDTGMNAAIQSSYRPIWACGVIPTVLAVHLLEGGVTAWGHDAVFDYCDRIVRVYQGHPGIWDLAETAKWDNEWNSNKVSGHHMAAWKAWRSLSPRAVWTGRPERPHPPALSASGRTITGTFDSYQSDNGSAIIRRDVRYRRVGDSNWTMVQGAGGSFSLTGLAAATEYDVQVRLVNAFGGGPWSVNSPLDAGAAHDGKFRGRIATS